MVPPQYHASKDLVRSYTPPPRLSGAYTPHSWLPGDTPGPQPPRLVAVETIWGAWTSTPACSPRDLPSARWVSARRGPGDSRTFTTAQQ